MSRKIGSRPTTGPLVLDDRDEPIPDGTRGTQSVVTSTDGGASWSVEEVSTQTTNPQFEQFGDRDVPFFDDYNYISSGGGSVLMTWTDSRDTVPGNDPRYPIDGTTGSMFSSAAPRTPTAPGGRTPVRTTEASTRTSTERS